MPDGLASPKCLSIGFVTVLQCGYPPASGCAQAMQAQNIMWGPTWMTVLMFFANFGLNVWLMRSYGFYGVAYAQSAGRIVQFVLLVCESSFEPTTQYL